MRSIYVKSLIFSTLFAVSQCWACSRPEKPVLPESGAIDPGKMMETKVAVSSYLIAQKSYLKDCVINNKAYNKIVLEMRGVAKDFNDLLHQFDDYQMRRFAADDSY